MGAAPCGRQAAQQRRRQIASAVTLSDAIAHAARQSSTGKLTS